MGNGLQWLRFIYEHDWNVIPNFVTKATVMADQFVLLRPILELALAFRTGQDLEQTFIQHDSRLRAHYGEWSSGLTRKPRNFRAEDLLRHPGSGFTHRSRYTSVSRNRSTLVRAVCPRARIASPPRPRMMGFCDSRSTNSVARMYTGC